MRKLKLILSLLLVVCVTAAFAANGAALVSATDNETVLKFKLTDYNFKKVQTPRGKAVELIIPKAGKTLKKGAPALPILSASVLIPDAAKMKVKVINSIFVDIPNVRLAPSKGNLTRNIDPAGIPYEYGPEYDVDSFYPTKVAQLGTPYIARDFRGQAVRVYPIQYNPVTKVLRVYKKIVVRVFDTGKVGKNVLTRAQPLDKLSTEFRNVYSRQFINFSQAIEKYTTLGDSIGNMLIVSYTSFMTNMSDFVTWKESIGYNVDLVNYSTIGSAAALKTYVANYYNSNGLTFLLLVGDNAQVPVSSTSNGDSDNNYGYIVGGDHYLDIFVGRFSAENTGHVDTQVDRTIHYEQDVLSSATFFRHAIGMASNEGPGHNNEYDATHMNYILSDLSGDGYTTHTNYQDGGSTSALSTLINNGAGTMWYCGHGSNTSWSCGWSFTNTNVDALTNVGELPAIFSVACVVGNFKSITCFCEAWQRATGGGSPTGSVVHAGSTINQSWTPPMDAQDEMCDILITSRRTFGGCFVNGMFKMIDINGANGEDMADTWTCFGDASVQLRTPGTPDGPTPSTPDPPVADFTGSPTSLMAGGSVDFSDTSTNSPTSWSWSFTGGTPSSSTAQDPTVTYNSAGSFTVELTATNAAGNDTETKVSYITAAAMQAPVANFTGSPTTIYEGGTVNFTDTSTNSPTSWAWTFSGGSPSSSTAQNPSVTYSTAGTYTVSLTASNSTGSDGETKTDYITVQVQPISYCASQGNDYSYEWIAGVNVGDIANSSGAAGYTDFTSITGSLTAGANAGVSLTPGFASSSYSEYWIIWIDYNADGDFTDSGEQVFSGNGTSTVSGSFTVQAGASGITRMRVSMKYNAAPTSCETFTYGEVEDYTVNITGAVPQPPVAGFTASSTTINEGQSVTFTDTSTENPTSWSWTFEGGTPATSTAQNPTVTYNTAGAYNVTLTAANAYGSDDEVKVDYITVNVVSADEIADAVDNGSLTFTKSGSADWYKDTGVYYYDGDSAGSGAITHNQSTTIETSVTVGSTQAVKFYWKVSSETNYDYLRFYIDGVEQTTIAGTVDWTQVAYNIGAGTHTLKWSYTKDGSVSSGSDRGWVDKLEITAPAADAIAEAVDYPALTFSLSGNGDWFPQTTTTYFDGGAAESANIVDSQTTTMETTISGKTSVKFYWKVSSESNYDYLRFYIDGVEQDQISGTVDWTQKTYTVSSGAHTLKWSFTKDGSVSSGSDTGWVDKLELQ
ncbi:MAG: PKD domain-containing protein [Candidatus Aminicenantes bacterium]|nr:PKD domain-containing protein [Candidatus Aminicenantes bacterium]